LSRKGWLLFAALCIIWGIPYLLIRVAVREISPATLVFLRTAPAALLLLPFALRRGQLRPLLGRWRWVLAYTVAELAVPWLLLARAEQHLSSSLSGLLVAAVPLLGAVLYRFSSAHDPLGPRRLLGLMVGFAGVAALVGIDVGHVDLAALAEMGVVVLGYTLGPFIISRRLADLPNLGVICASLVVTAVGYAPVALTHLPASVSWDVAASVAGLALVCTTLAFVLFFALILEVGPARSTVITYVNPAVAILLGVTVLGEPFTVGMAIGFPLVLAGMVLATSPSARRQDARPVDSLSPDSARPPTDPGERDARLSASTPPAAASAERPGCHD
jgi:drug/metabolite transporter (DMT)-like permease